MCVLCVSESLGEIEWVLWAVGKFEAVWVLACLSVWTYYSEDELESFPTIARLEIFEGGGKCVFVL